MEDRLDLERRLTHIETALFDPQLGVVQNIIEIKKDIKSINIELIAHFQSEDRRNHSGITIPWRVLYILVLLGAGVGGIVAGFLQTLLKL